MGFDQTSEVRYLIISLLFAISSFSCEQSGKGNNEELNDFERKFDLKVLIDSSIKSTWDKVQYSNLEDTSRINRYLKILIWEYSKYPEDYFSTIGISKIKICKDLKSFGVKQAGVPDPYIETVFLDANFYFPRYDEGYFRHMMHHELHHCSEFYLWKDMQHKSPEWENLNDSNFKYGNGGRETNLKSNGKDVYSMTHPFNGFVNLYSTASQEEDRCELAAIIMNDERRTSLIHLCASDTVLEKKVSKVMSYLDMISGTKDNYWRKNTRLEN